MFRVTREIDFCYGHRLLDYAGKCKFLHGHNGRAVIVIESDTLDERGMVLDFSDIKRVVSRWIDEHLDHRMLLPTRHSTIRVAEKDYEVEVTFEDRRWVFPREDCALLPVENTTAELLAHWIGVRLRDVIASRAGAALESIQIEVEENFGQWAVCTFTPSS